MRVYTAEVYYETADNQESMTLLHYGGYYHSSAVAVLARLEDPLKNIGYFPRKGHVKTWENGKNIKSETEYIEIWREEYEKQLDKESAS